MFLLQNSLQVDLSFAPEDLFASTGEAFELLFGAAGPPSQAPRTHPVEAIGWGWLYALHARSAIARGRVWQAVQMLEGLRGQVSTLACLRHQLPAHEGRGVDRLPQSMLDDLAETLMGRTTERDLTITFTRLLGLLLGEADHVSPKRAERLRQPLRTLETTAAHPLGEQVGPRASRRIELSTLRSQHRKGVCMRSKNPLERYFLQNKGRQIHKWPHYFEIYHRHLQRFRSKPITVIEFGVQFGGSLQMWRDYFGPRARLVGVDIEPRCKQWEEPGTRIFIGDQSDRKFLEKIAQKAGPIDVVVEDGGHHPDQQIATFEVMYPLIKPDGIFVIEDLHTSCWSSYSGGRGRPGTFMEYAKDLTDQLNAFHSRTPGFEPTEFTKTTKSIHFYDSVVVVEKGERPVRPTHQRTGKASWNPTDHVQLKPRLSARAEMAARKVARRGRRTLRRGISRATDRHR